MSTTVAPLGSGSASSRLNLDAVKPRPATYRGLALPSFSLTDDGGGPRVKTLMLQMPDFDLGGVSVASSLGDQRLPAVFRDAALAGPALASPARRLTFMTTGGAPLSLSFGQMPASTAGKAPTAPTFAAAAVSFTPSRSLSVTPRVLIPNGSPDARTTVGTAIRANVVSNVAMTTDVGIAGTADTSWVPLATARLVGQWPRAGIETLVLRGAAAPRTGGNTALVPSRDREAAQAQVRPLPGLTVAALTSVSRPSSDPVGHDTTLGSLRVAYDGLSSGQVAAVQQREATGSRESDMTTLDGGSEGRSPDGPLRASEHVELRTVGCRYRARLASKSTCRCRRRVRRCARPACRAHGRVDSSPTDSGVSSRVSGRVALIDDAALTGETEVGSPAGTGRCCVASAWRRRCLWSRRHVSNSPTRTAPAHDSLSARCSKHVSCGESDWAGRRTPRHLFTA